MAWAQLFNLDSQKTTSKLHYRRTAEMQLYLELTK